MASKRPNYTSVEHWETIAVTALPPGWRNVYRHDGDAPSVDPCPALLLQEHRATTKAWDRASGERVTKTDAEEPPYATRVVFADIDTGELVPAVEIGNYLTTLAPGEDLPEDPKGGSPS